MIRFRLIKWIRGKGAGIIPLVTGVQTCPETRGPIFIKATSRSLEVTSKIIQYNVGAISGRPEPAICRATWLGLPETLARIKICFQREKAGRKKNRICQLCHRRSTTQATLFVLSWWEEGGMGLRKLDVVARSCLSKLRIRGQIDVMAERQFHARQSDRIEVAERSFLALK